MVRIKGKHKYGAQAHTYNGTKYPSKLEALCASVLTGMEARGEILFFLEQIPIRLMGGKKHRVDFFVVTSENFFFIEAKGHDLAEGKRMRAMAEERIKGIPIHVVRKPEQIYLVIREEFEQEK